MHCTFADLGSNKVLLLLLLLLVLCNLTVYIVIVDIPVAYLFCSVDFFFHVIHLLCVFILLFVLSLITCTIFIGGTITTIASLFNY